MLSVLVLYFSDEGELGGLERIYSGKRLLWEEAQTFTRLYLHLEILVLKGSQLGRRSRKARDEQGEAMKGQGSRGWKWELSMG